MKPKINKILLGMVAIILANLIYLYTHLDYGYFSVITTFILIQKFYAELYLKILERIIGPAVAFGLTFFIVKFLHDYFIPYLMLSVSVVFVFAYYYAGTQYIHAMLWAVMTCALMTIIGYTSSAEMGIRLGFYWVLNIIIGALIVWITDVGFKILLKIPIQFKATKKKLMDDFYLSCHRAIQKIDFLACIIAARITLTLLVIATINYFMKWDYINLQAIIAGTVISAQLSLKKTHHRAAFRMTGALLGTLLSVIYVIILLDHPSTFLEGVFIVGTLTLCIFLTEKFPYLEYIFSQIGIIIPLILIHPNTEQYNLVLTVYRGLGTMEGGIIGILMEYLFYMPVHYYNKHNKH